LLVVHKSLVHVCPSTSSTLYPYTTLFRSMCYRKIALTPFLFGTAEGTTAPHCRMPGRDFVFARINHVAICSDDYALNGRFYEARSEEHTSELQSRGNLVCRLLLDKKNRV